MSRSPLTVWLERDGALLRLRLARPKANIVDAAMIAAIDEALATYLGNGDLCAVLIDAEGPHFSFGASVDEHLPAQCADMLGALHSLIGRIVASPVPVLVVVTGQCLGGGLELAAAAHLIFAGRDAMFGQPEIKIGVFAPAASVLLPERVGRMRAEAMLLSGRSIDAGTAVRYGLAIDVSDDPVAAALDFFDRDLADKSASSLRYAARAARGTFAADISARLQAAEALYLDELMQTRDAVEGLDAFLGKRPAHWENC